jgi:S1-C subfamily serine protease
MRASDSVVGIHTSATEDASSSETLGRERVGSGVVIGPDGLVLTIGYLILEAEDIELVLDDGRRLPARAVAYDLASGFGLVQPVVPLKLEPAPLGRASALTNEDALLVVSGGDGGALSVARLASRRPFSGYWEYHIDDALFTSPPRTDHSGAGLFNSRGELVGIGSLIVMDAPGQGQRGAGNMFVPVDLLKPIMSELRERGASSASRRAWMGANCVEREHQIRVVRVAPNGPAEAAGLQPGDVISRIDGAEVGELSDLYHLLWAGASERDVRLDILREGQARSVMVHTMDRMQTLHRARGI